MSALDFDDQDMVVEEGVDNEFLNMSDADLLNVVPGKTVKETVVEPVAEVVEEAEDTEAAEEATPEVDAPASSSLAADDAEVNKTPKPATSKKGEPEAVVEVEEEKPAVVTPTVDFEKEYKRLLTPFKANGKDIAVENVDDAIALMQMGANYNKKMAALKPNLKLMKMLENNGFMSEEKIGFLIDLGKKDPAAINKLVKDAGIDPMDLDGEKASTYKQTTYAVDDREMDLDTVLDDLQGTPTYTRTLDVVSNKWDVASKQIISQSPQLLKVINDHVASGIYDQISNEVERERVFGRLKGLSDIEAYRQIGDAIQARGGFSQPVKAPEVVKTAPVVVTPKPKVDDDKLKDKRRAASATQPSASSAMASDFNPLQLSDEEFIKLGNPRFL